MCFGSSAVLINTLWTTPGWCDSREWERESGNFNGASSQIAVSVYSIYENATKVSVRRRVLRIKTKLSACAWLFLNDARGKVVTLQACWSHSHIQWVARVGVVYIRHKFAIFAKRNVCAGGPRKKSGNPTRYTPGREFGELRVQTHSFVQATMIGWGGEGRSGYLGICNARNGIWLMLSQCGVTIWWCVCVYFVCWEMQMYLVKLDLEVRWIPSMCMMMERICFFYSGNRNLS